MAVQRCRGTLLQITKAQSVARCNKEQGGKGADRASPTKQSAKGHSLTACAAESATRGTWSRTDGPLGGCVDKRS